MIRVEEEAKSLHPQETDDILPTAWKSGSLKYDELKPLAEGGTAKLYVAFDKNLGRNVAYKTLHTDLRDSDIETKRFLREARVTANIQHPGTLPVYELGRDREGQLFFTMKKVDGQDLRQILHDLKQEVPEVVDKFPLPRLLDILIQVCQTLAFAHEMGVIHRDLKPANIIVGKFGEVYVLDWDWRKSKEPKAWSKAEFQRSPYPRI
jgi:serine/threonine-protein kinase